MKNDMLSAHFSLDELVRSETATQRKIDNTPTPEVVKNLRRLADVLEKIRHEVVNDLPLRISSGYRGKSLNTVVGGTANSAHLTGLAADLTCSNFGTPRELCAAIAQSEVPFDQVIVEFDRWVHVGLAPEGQIPRRQVLRIDQTGTRLGV